MYKQETLPECVYPPLPLAGPVYPYNFLFPSALSNTFFILDPIFVPQVFHIFRIYCKYKQNKQRKMIVLLSRLVQWVVSCHFLSYYSLMGKVEEHRIYTVLKRKVLVIKTIREEVYFSIIRSGVGSKGITEPLLFVLETLSLLFEICKYFVKMLYF